jgi:uncharacterized protein (DUF433 family)
MATVIRPAPGIVINPALRRGKPTIEGTRITVDEVLARFAASENIDGVLAAWPHLTREQVRAAIAYARQLVRAQNEEPARSDTDAWLEAGDWREA